MDLPPVVEENLQRVERRLSLSVAEEALNRLKERADLLEDKLFLLKEEWGPLFAAFAPPSYLKKRRYIVLKAYERFARRFPRVVKEKRIKMERWSEAVERTFKALEAIQRSAVSALLHGGEVNDEEALKLLFPWDPFLVEMGWNAPMPPAMPLSLSLSLEELSVPSPKKLHLFLPAKARKVEALYPYVHRSCLRGLRQHPIYAHLYWDTHVAGGIMLLKQEGKVLLVDISLTDLHTLGDRRRADLAVGLVKALHAYFTAQGLLFRYTDSFGGISNDNEISLALLSIPTRRVRERWTFPAGFYPPVEEVYELRM